MKADLTITTQSVQHGNPKYSWVNIEWGKTRVGKARIQKAGESIIVRNINIFEGFEGQGFARQTIDQLKKSATKVVADRVRPTARGFWERLGFLDAGDGNFVWRRRQNTS